MGGMRLQVTLIAVDKAYLELLPYEQPLVADVLDYDWSPDTGTATSLQDVITADAVLSTLQVPTERPLVACMPL